LGKCQVNGDRGRSRRLHAGRARGSGARRRHRGHPWGVDRRLRAGAADEGARPDLARADRPGDRSQIVPALAWHQGHGRPVRLCAVALLAAAACRHGGGDDRNLHRRAAHNRDWNLSRKCAGRGQLGADGRRLSTDAPSLPPIAALGRGAAADCGDLRRLQPRFRLPALTRPRWVVEGSRTGNLGPTMTNLADFKSGKTERDENFPVASVVIARRCRVPILAFYRFARAADDVADHPRLAEGEKLAALDLLEATLLGRTDAADDAVPLRRALADTGLTPGHALDLLTAFRLDVSKRRYRNWDELMHYCNYSAMPVGRFVLDVHGEARSTWPASDALCTALQVINHLQDCAKDYCA